VVYNLRVADHRTYFVGDDTWSFAAWAHNAYGESLYAFISGRTLVNRLVANGFQLRQEDKEEILKFVLQMGGEGLGYGVVANLDQLINKLKASFANVSWDVKTIKQKIQSYFNDENVKNQRSTLERAVHNKSGWADYIETTLNDRDARGKSRQEYLDEILSNLGLNPNDPNTIHGHHIIYKLASRAAKDEARDARDILLYYGINPYWDRENLAYAPNQGHPKAAIIYMHRELLKAVNGRRSREHIIEMVKNFATAYIYERLPGMRNYRQN
jgi:hypothetical protein